METIAAPCLWILLALGFAVLLLGLLAWYAPRLLPPFANFPRNRPLAVFLVALDSLWIYLLLAHMGLGFLEFIRPFLIPLAVLLFAACLWAMPDLLPVRAAGGFLLLAASPLADAAMPLAGPARVAAMALDYALVVLGALFLLYPWLWTRLLPRPATPGK